MEKKANLSSRSHNVSVASYERRRFLHVARGKQNNHKTSVGEGSGERSEVVRFPGPRQSRAGARGGRSECCLGTVPRVGAGHRALPGIPAVVSTPALLPGRGGRWQAVHFSCSPRGTRKGFTALRHSVSLSVLVSLLSVLVVVRK